MAFNGHKKAPQQLVIARGHGHPWFKGLQVAKMIVTNHRHLLQFGVCNVVKISQPHKTLVAILVFSTHGVLRHA